MRDVQFIFDLDGTITREELLPLIADEIGLREEISLITHLTLQGSISFDASFRLRVEILKQIELALIRSVVNRVPLHRLILAFIKENQNQCCIATNNLDVWIHELCTTIGCQYFCSQGKNDNGKLLGIRSILRKSDCLKKFGNHFTVAIGDGMNDAELIRKASFGIAFGGAHDIPQGLLEVAKAAVYTEKQLCKLLNQLLLHARELDPA